MTRVTLNNGQTFDSAATGPFAPSGGVAGEFHISLLLVETPITI